MHACTAAAAAAAAAAPPKKINFVLNVTAVHAVYDNPPPQGNLLGGRFISEDPLHGVRGS